MNKAEYKNLLKKVVEYRNEMCSKLKITHNDYYKIYSEIRQKGMRTKFWGARNDVFIKVQKYIKKNPYVKVGDNLYHVDVNYIGGRQTAPYFYHRQEAVNISFKFTGKSK